MSIEDYLSREIVKIQKYKLGGEVIWTIGSLASLVGLSIEAFIILVLGFLMLFVGSCLSFHYELRRIDYTNFLEQLSSHGY